MHRRAALLLLLLPAACAPQAPAPTLPGGPSGTTDARYLTVGERIAGFYANPQPNQPAAANTSSTRPTITTASHGSRSGQC